MKLSHEYEHEQCFHFERSAKPAIEMVRIAEGDSSKLEISNNEVVFFMEGRVRFIFGNFPDYEGKKGEILFLPAGGRYSYTAINNSLLVIFRIRGPIVLCDNYSVEKLYGSREKGITYLPHTRRRFSVMDINTRIWHFLDGIIDSLNDGVKCKVYFDLKIKEFFMLVRLYYTKKDIYDFLYLILSEDTSFSEYVRMRWHRFRNVEEMAEYMHLTPRQFSERFKKIFAATPYKWMKEERTKIIRQQLISTNKPIKQVAFENGFSDLPQFTKFCKKEIGKTPTDIRASRNTSPVGIDNK